jgi:hypothetical protein
LVGCCGEQVFGVGGEAECGDGCGVSLENGGGGSGGELEESDGVVCGADGKPLTVGADGESCGSIWEGDDLFADVPGPAPDLDFAKSTGGEQVAVGVEGERLNKVRVSEWRG